MKTYQEALVEICGSISRKKANFAFTGAPPGSKTVSSPGVKNEFALSVGSYQAVRVDGGFIITMGITRDRLIEIRDLCNELLGVS